MITLKEHLRKREFVDQTDYYLEVMINEKPTGILIVASSIGGVVHGSVEIYFAGVWENCYRSEYPHNMDLEVIGNVITFKKYVMENIDNILDFAGWNIIFIKNRSEEMCNILLEAIPDR